MHSVQKDEHETESASWEAAGSSWVDGDSEVRAEELDTPYGRQVWETYHLIGDVLRDEHLAIKPSPMFYARLSRAVDAEPTVLAPRNRVRSHWRSGVSGMAIAAAVAVVAWLVMPLFADDPALDVPTMPPAQVAAASPEDDTSLHDYLDAHEGL